MPRLTGTREDPVFATVARHLMIHAAVVLLMVGVHPPDSFAQPQPASAMRVVTFGTSLTARGGWQDELSAALNRCLGTEVDVINLGKSGAASDWGVQAVESVIAAKPDIVLIEFSVNDAALHRGVRLEQSRANIRTIVSKIREAHPQAKIYLMAMSPVLGWRGLLRPFLDGYYDSYLPLSKELNVGFIDHRPAWRALGDAELRSAIADGAHPDPAVARKIIVPRIVQSIAGPSCEG